MPRRPLSSAGDARPQTSSGFPPPGAGQSIPAGGLDRDPQYTNSIEEEEEEEESDAEDLFAFLPPSTADQEKQFQEHTESQQADTPKQNPDPDEMFAVSVPSLQQASISPPPPIYDPSARYPADSDVGPSGTRPPLSRLPVESPPSTGSQHLPTDGAYPMRRVNQPLAQPHSASTGTRPSRTSGVSSREVHVRLPSPLEKSIDEAFSHRDKHRSSTTADTLSGVSVTPSMMEQDSRDGSVK
jgi:hypothetical protein